MLKQLGIHAAVNEYNFGFWEGFQQQQKKGKTENYLKSDNYLHEYPFN